jgi:hypothetical protein
VSQVAEIGDGDAAGSGGENGDATGADTEMKALNDDGLGFRV